jgi:hypothetical protein
MLRASAAAALLPRLRRVGGDRRGRPQAPDRDPAGGAVDGLNVVVPHADQAYYQVRPTIAITRLAHPTGRWRSTAISGCIRRWPS